jgi:hypothetical protein
MLYFLAACGANCELTVGSCNIKGPGYCDQACVPGYTLTAWYVCGGKFIDYCTLTQARKQKCFLGAYMGSGAIFLELFARFLSLSVQVRNMNFPRKSPGAKSDASQSLVRRSPCPWLRIYGTYLLFKFDGFR